MKKRSTKTMHHNLTIFDPFHATGPSQYPLKISKNQGFLIFSGGTKKDQLDEMG